MGNTSSNANPHRLSQRRTSNSPSASPTPGNPHPSLRQKKKSLELPDLAFTQSRGRANVIPPKSASIPIPGAIAGDPARTRPPPTFPSTIDVLDGDERSTHRYYPHPIPSRAIRRPPTSRHNSSRHTSRSRQQQQQQQQAHLQDLYNQSNLPPPPSPTVFVQEIVHSSIPIALPKTVLADDPAAIAVLDGPPELVPVKITWRSGGKVVYLARAGDDDWKGRQLMEPESGRSTIYHTMVALPPGTHHIRFLVDDQWRVADDLPTAVDDQGSLANYVAVPLSYSPPTTAIAPLPQQQPQLQQRQPAKRQPGQSFWSAASSTDDESIDNNQPPQPQTPQQPRSHVHHHHQPAWTSVFPPELIEAAREEEAYLLASSGQLDSRGTTYISGFVPAPNIPPAPGLPRHLDRLILNSRVVTGGAGGAVVGAVVAGISTGSATGKSSGRNTGSGKYGAGTGATNSVGGRSKGRERDRKDKEERERRRGERRGGSSGTTAPPPSEAGGSRVHVVISEPVSAGSGPGSGSTSPTPTPASLSPTTSTTPTPASTAATTPTLASPTLGSTMSASGAVVSPSLSMPSSPPSTPNPTRPLTQALGLDSSPTPALTDDGSVLPVPSHVVLHHLSTSSIRNGVLAVANTTRYRKKYLTTVYYKPT